MWRRYLRIPTCLDKKAWESADTECIQKWFKCAKMATRFPGDPKWVAVVRLAVVNDKVEQSR